LGEDQPGVGGRVGVGAQVVLVDVREPVTGERLVVRVGDRGEPDVAGLGDEQRGHADR
jgi:hypothetical protein